MIEYFSIIYCLIFGACSGPLCFDEVMAENRYTVCRVDHSKSRLQLFLKDENDVAYGSLQRLKSQLDAAGQKLRFAMNGGMYHRDYSPVGLYIADGVLKKTISTKGGYGNFHLLPNGVFYFGPDGAGVMETRRYMAAKLKPQFATQSGPMLVIEGELHPRFLKDSDSLKIRNGVGVTEDGRIAYFAISHSPVRFWDFGELFKSRLNTPNALFLDGSISSLLWEDQNRGVYFPAGPIIGVVE